MKRFNESIELFRDFNQIILNIDEELNALQTQPVSRVLESDFVEPYLSTSLADRLLDAELRSLLELAKTQIHIRKGLSDVVASHGSNPQNALHLLNVIAREREYLFNDPVMTGEVFYEGFRKSMRDACRNMLQRIESITEPQAASLTSLLTILGPDDLFEWLSAVEDGSPASDRILSLINIELLVSDEMREKASFLAHIFRERLARRRSVCSKLERYISGVWGEIAKPEPARGMVEAFKECFYTHLRDSKYLINAFADLLGRRSSIDDRIKNCWREIFLSLTESVIPKLRMLANPKIGRDVCDRLERAVGEVVSLVSKGNELARTLLDGATSASDRDKAEEGFIAAVNKLHGLLFKDQEDSVWKALSLLRTDLNLVVNRVLERFRPDLDSASIVVDIANPYELLVFGQRTHVYTAISNLVENVCTRAFKQAAIGDRRCSIRVALAEGDNTVRLAVLDNGCGVGPSLRHGGGLSTVEDIALYLCQDWDVQSAKDGFSTEAYLTFYVLEESSRS